MRRLVPVALLAALALGGCTGVPSSSAPETVKPVITDSASNSPAPAPNLDKDARTIVQTFLTENVPPSGNYTIPRAYLTPAARTGWSTQTATIISDDYTEGTYDARRHTVNVTGRVVGTVDASGIYTPNQNGIGGGGDPVVFTFHIAQVHNENRISKLPTQLGGLLLSDSQFRTSYQQRILYFYDLAQKVLIPDVRWSPLDDRVQLAQWLIGQLASGPRTSLQNAVHDTLPAQVDPAQIVVTPGNPISVEIPGTSQLDGGARTLLAAQVAQTLFEPLAGQELRITDGGKPVLIPKINGTVFTSTDFAGSTGPSSPASELYYLDDGRIRDQNGKPLTMAGNVGALTSVALSQAGPAGSLLVAGETGTGAAVQLAVGTQRGGMQPTGLEGTLSRPAFAPGLGEVWVGDGSKVYRVGVEDAKPRPYRVALPAQLGGQVLALRFSPEGSRVAILVSGAGGAGQLYIGSVVRGAGSPVRVDRWESISPAGVSVTDVAWVDPVRVFGIGYLVGSQSYQTFESGVDGSEWTNEGRGNLPNIPKSVAAASGANVWVSDVAGFVWEQSGSSWVSPGPTGQTPGTAPVYLE